MLIYKLIYWAGLIAEIIIRAPIASRVRQSQKTLRRVSLSERILLFLLSLAGFLLPLIYTFTPWLSFADYHLPAWLGWLGASLLVFAVFLFARGHLDLQSNWSPSLEIYAGHTLVTSGIYRIIRHPMYASQWVLSIAQILLLQNGLAGPAGLVVFIPFYILRVRAEERMMLATFGEAYREYMDQVGGVIPKRRLSREV